MNILFISQLYPLSKNSKTSFALHYFVKEWIKEHHVQVIRPYLPMESEEPPKSKKVNIENVTVNIVKPLWIPGLKKSIINKTKILSLIKQKPDVIICHLYNSYLTFAFLKDHFKVPFVVGIHGSDIRLAKSHFQKLRIKKVLKEIDLIAYRSIAIKNNFEKHVKIERHIKTFIAHSGIPKDLVKKAHKLKNDSHSKQYSNIKLLSVCRLIKLKQIDKVILALNNIKDLGINFKYTIIGSGPEKENLIKLTKKYNLENRVTFLGQIPRKNVFEIMNLNDIFIMPSYKETLGLVFLEAMANGCIVIGAKDWGIDGIVKHNVNGFLCDPYDSVEINNCINHVLCLNDKKLNEIRSNSLNTIVTFEEENMAKKYLQNINQLV